MTDPNIARVIADAKDIMRPPALNHISATALEVQILREMTEHQRYGQSMPNRDELMGLAAQTILAARGVIDTSDVAQIQGNRL